MVVMSRRRHRSPMRLITGEIDWWMSPQRICCRCCASPEIRLSAPATRAARCATMRFNQLHPPFDNPAIRRAIMHAVRQSDYMISRHGRGPCQLARRGRVFLPGHADGQHAGMENLTSPRDLDAARTSWMRAGYHGERVVLLCRPIIPKFQALAEVSADLLRKLGINFDLQSMDYGDGGAASGEPGAGGPRRMEHLPYQLRPGRICSTPAYTHSCAATAATAHGLADQHADRGAARRMVCRRRPGSADRRWPSSCNCKRFRTCPMFRLANGAPTAHHRSAGYADRAAAVLEHQAQLTTASVTCRAAEESARVVVTWRWMFSSGAT